MLAQFVVALLSFAYFIGPPFVMFDDAPAFFRAVDAFLAR